MHIVIHTALLAINCVIGWLVYNLFFRPLRRYQGPLLWRGTTVFDAHHLHERYSPIVQLSPWELSYTSSDAWKDIHGTGNSTPRKPLPKNPLANPPPLSGEPGIIDVIDYDQHREQRQLFNQGFSTRALKEQEPLLRKHVDRLVAALKLHAVQGTEVNMVDMFNFLAFDVMGDLAFGASLGLLERSEYNSWVKVIVGTIKIVTIRIVVFYHIPFASEIVPLLIPKSMKAKRDAHMKFAEDRVKERLGRKTHRPDLWGLITGGPDGKKALLSVDQMIGNAALFMVVGSETTSTVLSGALYLLLRNLQCLAKLKKEVRDNFKSKEEMTFEPLAKLAYLGAVLDETMRVYPGTPEALARLVPVGGANICGEHVPQGTTVFILHYPMFHSSQNFVQPDSFVPERWLPEGATEFQRENKKALIHSRLVHALVLVESKCNHPNLTLPRFVINIAIHWLSYSLAQYEMRLVMYRLIWDLEFRLSEKCDNWMNQETYSFWLKPPMMVEVQATRRNE